MFYFFKRNALLRESNDQKIVREYFINTYDAVTLLNSTLSVAATL